MGNKPVIFITHPIPAEWIEPFKGNFDFIYGPAHKPGIWIDSIDSPESVQAILSMLSDPVRENVLSQFKNLKVVSNMAAGTDNVDLDYCRRENIRVGNTPGVLTDATADLTMALLLSLCRGISSAAADARNGNWNMWEPAGWMGRDLRGSTLGIYGMGKIGQAVAFRAKAFGMKIIYHNRKQIPAENMQVDAEYVDFETLLTQSDVLSIHAPLNPDTKGRFSHQEFKRMKPYAVLLNIGRGSIVDTGDLIEALEKDWISAAGLDVTDPEPLPPDHPLYKQKNCLIVPHIGSATEGTREKMFGMAMENIIANLSGVKLPYGVV